MLSFVLSCSVLYGTHDPAISQASEARGDGDAE